MTPRTIFISIIGGVVLLFSLVGFYIVDTGEIAVEKTLGRVDLEEIGEGMHWAMPLVTQRPRFVVKEISFDIEDMRPKAADNLSLADLDVTVYYKVTPTMVAETDVKYATSRARAQGGSYYPAYQLVWREARGAAYDAVSKIESLELHKKRDEIGRTIAYNLQTRLDQDDAGVFTITRVIIRALNTDPSIEKSIQLAVQNEKKLEAKRLEVEIARQDAQIEVERAKGIAKANSIINESLTNEYLQHEINLALQGFADNEGSVVVIPANMKGLDLILGGRNTAKN